MVVEVDGTTSPQITEQEGVTGRAVSGRRPARSATWWLSRSTLTARWSMDRRTLWTTPGVCRLRRPGRTADGLPGRSTNAVPHGARHNWELQQTHFPGAIPILDYYHAAEHLADYCKLLPATLRGAHERSLSTMMWEGEVLQMIHEMKRSLSNTDTDEGWKQINYFTNNQDRMDYALPRSRLADRQWLGRRA